MEGLSFSARRIYSNIRALAMKQGRGMNELEISVGTYPGYCLSHEKNTSVTDYRRRAGRNHANLEVIWRFSRELGVTINDLIEKEY